VLSFGSHEKLDPEYTHVFGMLTPRTPQKHQACLEIGGGGYQPYLIRKYVEFIKEQLNK
jgi:hypothetical protein